MILFYRDRHTDTQQATHRQTERQTNRQTDKQQVTHTHIYTDRQREIEKQQVQVLQPHRELETYRHDIRQGHSIVKVKHRQI